MEELQLYSPEAIIAANLWELNTRISLTAEQELAHLGELADDIVNGADLTPDFLTSLSEHSLTRGSTDACVSENAAPVGLRQRMAHVWRAICLCEAIERRLSAQVSVSPESFFADIEELSETAKDRVAYQRNAFADSAYLQLSALLGAPRATYARSFGAACESVCRRECEYCILPIENSQEGQLTGFWRLIARYGLRIAATCDVETTDKKHVTRFALLRATPISLSAKQADRFFGFSVQPQSQELSANVLYAAEHYGLSPAYVITNSAPLTGSAPASRFVFRVGNGNLIAFLLYLHMEIPDFTPLGLYPHLKNI